MLNLLKIYLLCKTSSKYINGIGVENHASATARWIVPHRHPLETLLQRLHLGLCTPFPHIEQPCNSLCKVDCDPSPPQLAPIQKPYHGLCKWIVTIAGQRIIKALKR